MTHDTSEEQFTEERVTYTLQKGETFVLVENVPARVSVQTGERFFSPETVEQLQALIWGEAEPVRVIATPVFRFAA
jgi:hypothetical protein